MMLNAAQFEGTGGWVLKPQGYLPVDGKQPAPDRVTLDVKVKLLAAQGLGRPDDAPNAYVKCELHVESKAEAEQGQIPRGGKNKGGEYKRRSTTRHDNNDPDFGGECKLRGSNQALYDIRMKFGTNRSASGIEFSGVQRVAPELSFLRYVFPWRNSHSPA